MPGFKDLRLLEFGFSLGQSLLSVTESCPCSHKYVRKDRLDCVKTEFA